MTRQEFDKISNGMRGDLKALARRFLRATGGPEEAEDIVQEALLALWELSERDYPIQSPKALAIKLTKNICVSRYRKRKVETVAIVDDTMKGGFSAEERTEAADNLRIKESIYNNLSESQRRLMTMRVEEGMSLDEIAKETGRPKSSLKVSLSEARKKLKEQLKKI